MKKIYAICIFFIASHTGSAITGTLVSVDPDSAFQGQLIDVTVTFPSGIFLTYGSPGPEINFFGQGLPTITSLYISNYNPWNDQITYTVQIPISQPAGIYDVQAFAGHSDPWNGWFVPDDTLNLPQSFVILETNVYGRLFIDNNANGIFEYNLGDRYWGNKKIDVFPDSISVYTDYNGYFLFTLPVGSHTVQYTTGPGEIITTGNSPAVVNVTSGSVYYLGDIGVQTPPSYYVYSYAWFGRRCNRVQNGYMYVSNASNRTVDINATLVKPSNIDFRSSVPAPASISGDTLRWNFLGINPGTFAYVYLVDSLPGAGAILNYSTLDIAYNGATPVDTFYRQFQYDVSCSFDPNDKSVNPPGQSTANYTLIGEDLMYHINFQNTGNDTAFDVVIRDTLDSDLDLSTFTFIGSSSPAIVTLDNHSRTVEFKMNNILLPDSNANEPGSHGYVDYKIRNVAGIFDGTEITNTAYIYFDFNPPVETNTTLNTMLSSVPVGLADPVSGAEVYVYPNPFSQDAQLVIRGKGEVSKLKIWNELGELQVEIEIHSDHYILSGADLTPGIYFYRLESKSQSRSGKFVYTGK